MKDFVSPVMAGKETYRYGFDRCKQLVMVERLIEPVAKEFLLHAGDMVLSLTFRKEPQIAIERYTECRHADGKLKSCIIVDTPNAGGHEYYREEYHYSEQGLDWADTVRFPLRKLKGAERELFNDWLRENKRTEISDFKKWYENKTGRSFCQYPPEMISEHRKYYFKYDEKGHLSEYQMVEYREGEIIKEKKRSKVKTLMIRDY